MSIIARTAQWAAVVLLLGSSTGCAAHLAYCEDKMDCEGGNEADVDACVVSLDADADRAALYGCEDLWDEYFLCREERSFCDLNQRHYDDGPVCQFERDRYNTCMH